TSANCNHSINLHWCRVKFGRGCTSTSAQYVPTTGTILVLNSADVIQLTEEYYALSSLGTFN
ncbi:MAG: hypothetical protein ACKPKO_32800, partial [Candidatus Fonsibacter sp.]